MSPTYSFVCMYTYDFDHFLTISTGGHKTATNCLREPTVLGGHAPPPAVPMKSSPTLQQKFPRGNRQTDRLVDLPQIKMCNKLPRLNRGIL